ncbi:hypothetical protein NQ318_015443 [Aromia moschata]|uniref:Uncharacterized protein n=1 Tax=Aromia moschata TaxID=1265417 RepID=A0AAV8XBC1_9CUCU|nr:hypothetical protein NQ318_015443 [Aromia moschata]
MCDSVRMWHVKTDVFQHIAIDKHKARKHEEYDVALSKYKTAVHDNPDSVALWNNIGIYVHIQDNPHKPTRQVAADNDVIKTSISPLLKNDDDPDRRLVKNAFPR